MTPLNGAFTDGGCGAVTGKRSEGSGEWKAPAQILRSAQDDTAAAGVVTPAGESGRGDATPLLALTGNLGYFVNVDAVTWFLEEVWPALRQTRPDIRVVVAGDRPARAIRRAVARAGSGARLVESPPDLRSILAQATLALAPMRCGSGVPIKVLEAWAVGVPVIATPWAAAGTSGRPGEDFQIAGAQPIEWASAVRELLDAPAVRERLVASSRRRLAADYSPEVVRAQLLAIFSSNSWSG